MPAASIIVPVYNALADAERCLESVYRARTEVPFEVIVVDNGSAVPFVEHLGSTRTKYTNFRVIRFVEPLGFPRAANEGARRARHEFLVLLNSDTIVTDRWLDGLMGALAGAPTVAVVGPVTNRCGNEAQVEVASLPKRTGIVNEPQTLNFFCAMIRRSVWERLAGLDEVYRTGNFDDDDFCLRARLAGYQLAVVPSVFVYHQANQTFEENGINLPELMARNQALFCERASRWSRAMPPAGVAASRQAETLSVIVPVLASTVSGLRDSLTSLCNQTVRGFETVLVHPDDVDVTPFIQEASGRLRFIRRAVPGPPQGLAALLNAGLASAGGHRIAYLPSGDVAFPFHLEVLLDALEQPRVDAAYCAWSVYSDIGGRPCRGAISFDQAEPVRLPWGDWAPLACWMHDARVTPAAGFDESLSAFTGWRFVLQISQSASFRYLRRITIERRLPPAVAGADLEAETILGVPSEPWQQHHRKEFLEAVRQGCWEQRLVIEKNQAKRRSRQLLGDNALTRLNTARMEAAFAKLPLHPQSEPVESTALPDIFLFSIIEWTALTQRPQHLARGLAARGHRVFWIDVQLKPPHLLDPEHLSTELASGLYRVELPGDVEQIYTLNWSRAALDLMSLVIERLNHSHGGKPAIQLVTFPKWTPLVQRLRDRFGWPVIYDCLDDQLAFSEQYKHDASTFEEELVQASRAVITASAAMFERYERRHPDVRMIPNAVDFETFHRAEPRELLGGFKRPVVGFFGAFSDWLDTDWISEAAAHFPDSSFVYIGRDTFANRECRERWARATAAPNITVLPQMDLSRLASYLAEFDVCIMPFRDLPITRAMNPVKIYEYLAAGKTVVVPELPETRVFAQQGLIEIYSTREESFRLLRQAVSMPPSESQIAARVRFAAANDWSARLDDFEKILLLF